MNKQNHIWCVFGTRQDGSPHYFWAAFDSKEKAERYPGPRGLELANRIVVEYGPIPVNRRKRRIT
jgi:hypothetical protein